MIRKIEEVDFITLRVDRVLKQAFDNAAASDDRKTSQVLRILMREYVEKMKGGKKLVS